MLLKKGMKVMQKKVLAINDISCVGRCSLTVALPIISSVGLECSILPTAILSTHTGGFGGYTFLDFTDEMKRISNHWLNINRTYDAIYTGFLGSKEQVSVVKDIVSKFKKEKNIVIVDPAMADNGILYKIFDDSFPLEMKQLCLIGDIIIPNITEACLLTNYNYQIDNHNEQYIDGLIKALLNEGMKNIVLTGVSNQKGKIGALCYNYKTKQKYFYDQEIIPGYYHGTGDVFASVFTSAFMKGKTIEESTKIAVDITVLSIKETIKYQNIDPKYGVCFEEVIPNLINKIK